MRHFRNLLLLAFVITGISSGCDHDYQKKISAYCDYPTGDIIDKQIGRVYKWSDSSSGDFFYYVGNVDSTLRAGGFVPCNNLPENLKPMNEIGLAVIYSGIVKLGRDAEEPIYFGIEITEIKRRQ